MTREEFNSLFNNWVMAARAVAVDMGFSDDELTTWARANFEKTLQVFLAEPNGGPEPVASVHAFLMNGWDPKLPEGFVPQDGNQDIPFEPEDK